MSEPKPAPVVAAPVGPSFAVKLIVSLFIVFHLTCIVINVSAAGSAPYFAPDVIQIAQVRYGVVRGWLASIFQMNAYRFYAPNPGPCDLLWVRLKYAKANDPRKEIIATRWYETPNREEHFLRMPFQRDLAACMLLSMYVEPAPVPGGAPGEESGAMHFNEVGKIALASFVRHLSQRSNLATLTVPGETEPLVLVGMDAYKVAHLILTPVDVKVGCDYTDPRFYEVYFLGRFNPKGEREDGENDVFVPHEIHELFALIVQNDLQDEIDRRKLNVNDKETLRAFLIDMGLPKPFRPAILGDPSILARGQTRAQLMSRFEKETVKNDNPVVKSIYGLQPQSTSPQVPSGVLPNPGFGPDQSLQNRVAPTTPRGRQSPSIK